LKEVYQTAEVIPRTLGKDTRLKSHSQEDRDPICDPFKVFAMNATRHYRR